MGRRALIGPFAGFGLGLTLDLKQSERDLWVGQGLARLEPSAPHLPKVSSELMEETEGASVSPLQELADIRQRHQQRFKEREAQAAEEERRLEQEQKDAELAEQYAKEEEEARLKQLEADEEYSRQLAAQLNPGGYASDDGTSQRGSQPLQEFNSGEPQRPPDDAELAAYYQQLEDGEAEGYRAPMRTGYVERLIDAPQDLSWAWAMLQGPAASADAAREPMVSAGQEEVPPRRSFGRYLVPVAASVSVVLLVYILDG
ncbi:unnamed protein product [Effrenium voratum]|nr:unnamed protein product [Effrenium voratum]